LSNAAKFTKEGTITLKVVREAAAAGAGIAFEVHDTGIGMSAEQMQKIFVAFSQADASTTRKFGGTGLGLTITSRLCQMMGGTIGVRSEPGKGSTFSIWLPVEMAAPPRSAPAGPAAAQQVPPSVRLRGNVVLVVDDESAARDMVSHHLALEGFRVVTSSNGPEAIRLAKEVRPQVITLDVMMPGMDGWAVLSALKSDPETAAIPVVIVSIIDDKNLGHALGAADYLVKPLERDRLLGVLKKHCPFPSSGLALIAEDDPTMREMLRRVLEKEDWAVYEAANGRQALACVAEQRPTLILLDLMMPEMDGFEFLTELSNNPQWQAIPVVIITAKELTEEERMFLNGSMLLGGCVKRVLKKGSFSRDELLRDVRELVSREGDK
jgi:CheY-like chemotaxis protein